MLPPTDVLSTETEIETTISTTTEESIEDTADAPLPDWTIGRVIALAPRVDNSRYHQGSTTPESALIETSDFHFSPPDRAVNCSADGQTLACRLNTQRSGPTPSNVPRGCEWKGNLVTLDTQGTEDGVCSEQFPVLYRSTIVDFGHTISISRLSCLVETAGLFCLESRSDAGFAITPTGYREITSSDRAPRELLGLAGSSAVPPGAGTDVPQPPTTTVAPTN
ncbi:hypothetical protein V1Y59_02010 [Gordonia sp. PKS22-38]|uniref:Uncharacterized protein n=1 Tax=Gordonia prachuapensis TaxID=3115651 RepID=A0ABU7MNE3_9ACTN|nr:hypothetical protein [Gordonia sp. PKS22-38]